MIMTDVPERQIGGGLPEQNMLEQL